MPTSPIDVLLAAYNALSPGEREALFKRLSELRLRAVAAGEGETARHIASLRHVAQHLGKTDFSVDEYREAYKQLRTAGDESVIELNKLIRFFGRWSLAKEALDLSAINTAVKIEARFRARVAGRPRQFNEHQMRDALHDCARELGRTPLSEEYRKWRQKEIDLASARGDEAWLPSYNAYYRRFSSWEAALVHYGFDLEQYYRQLERRPTDGKVEVGKVDRYTDETLEAVFRRAAARIGHIPMAWEFEEWRRPFLKKSRAKSISLPSSSPYRRRFGSWDKALLHYGYTEEEISARRQETRERTNKNLEASSFRGKVNMSAPNRSVTANRRMRSRAV